MVLQIFEMFYFTSLTMFVGKQTLFSLLSTVFYKWDVKFNSIPKKVCFYLIENKTFSVI